MSYSYEISESGDGVKFILKKANGEIFDEGKLSNHSNLEAIRKIIFAAIPKLALDKAKDATDQASPSMVTIAIDIENGLAREEFSVTSSLGGLDLIFDGSDEFLSLFGDLVGGQPKIYRLAGDVDKFAPTGSLLQIATRVSGNSTPDSGTGVPKAPEQGTSGGH